MNSYYLAGYDLMRGLLDLVFVQWAAFLLPFFALRWVIGFFHKINTTARGASYKKLEGETEDIRSGFARWRK